MVILSKAHKLHNFEPQNSLKVSFTYIQRLCSNFARCESFLESSSPNILALCKTNLDDSTLLAISLWRAIFLESEMILSLRCIVLQFILRKEFLLYRTICRKLWEFLFMFWTGFASFSVLLFSPLPITFFAFVSNFWYYFIKHRWGFLDQPIC